MLYKKKVGTKPDYTISNISYLSKEIVNVVIKCIHWAYVWCFEFYAPSYFLVLNFIILLFQNNIDGQIDWKSHCPKEHCRWIMPRWPGDNDNDIHKPLLLFTYSILQSKQQFESACVTKTTHQVKNVFTECFILLWGKHNGGQLIVTYPSHTSKSKLLTFLLRIFEITWSN